MQMWFRNNVVTQLLSAKITHQKCFAVWVFCKKERKKNCNKAPFFRCLRLKRRKKSRNKTEIDESAKKKKDKLQKEDLIAK